MWTVDFFNDQIFTAQVSAARNFECFFPLIFFLGPLGPVKKLHFLSDQTCGIFHLKLIKKLFIIFSLCSVIVVIPELPDASL